MILRGQNRLTILEGTKFLTSLLNINDKKLRRIIISHIINDIKKINKHTKNQYINR